MAPTHTILTDEILTEFEGYLEPPVRRMSFLYYGYNKEFLPPDDLWWESQEAINLYLELQPTCLGFWRY